MPIGCPIFVRSSRLEDRPVKAEERRDRIGCAIQSGNLELWIDLRTCAANGWSSVALAQLFELNRGPSPLLDCPPMLPVTESIAMDRACAAAKYGDSILFSPGIGLPAPGAPPRSPGSSVVADCAGALETENFRCDDRYTLTVMSVFKGSGREIPSAVMFRLPSVMQAGAVEGGN
jgi:hypothetical protein